MVSEFQPWFSSGAEGFRPFAVAISGSFLLGSWRRSAPWRQRRSPRSAVHAPAPRSWCLRLRKTKSDPDLPSICKTDTPCRKYALNKRWLLFERHHFLSKMSPGFEVLTMRASAFTLTNGCALPVLHPPCKLAPKKQHCNPTNL